MNPTIRIDGALKIITWPAFTYIENVADDHVMDIDITNTHGDHRDSFRLAVPFQTRTHGTMHKHFSIGVYTKDRTTQFGTETKGEPYTYANAVSLTSHQRPHEFIPAARFGQYVRINKGHTYRIERDFNDNIKLVKADV